MARELKFRAWDKGHNKMFYKVNLYSMNARGEIDKAQIGNQQVMKGIGFACEIMQYTGLKDKNGKEIYEGDIMAVVQRTVGSGDRTKYKTFNIPVEFYNGEFRLPFQDYGEYRFRDGNFRHFEVIGNIYENPELLK